MFCKLCGGLLRSMGALGRLEWFRCRNCGCEYSLDDRKEKHDDNDNR